MSKKREKDYESTKTRLEEFMYAHVESVRDSGEGKKASQFVKCRTNNGPLDFKYWKPGMQDRLPAPGDYLKVHVWNMKEAMAEFEKYECLCLDKLYDYKTVHCGVEFISRDDVPEEYRDVIKRDREPQIKFAKKTIVDPSFWTDKRAHEFLSRFMEDNWERFRTAPAALGHHHAFRGGLLVHSCEVFANCHSHLDSPAYKFGSKKPNSDVLYLAAWLHDAGKMDVYSMDGDAPRIDSKKEDLIGHSTISNTMFVRAAADFGGFDGDFVDEVSHCILSHHGRKEWGAVVEPKTLEARLLSTADYQSSRMAD